MGQEQDIKIRTLPRKEEVAKEKKPEATPPQAQSKRWIIYVGTVSCLLLAAAALAPAPPKSKEIVKATHQQKDLASQAAPSRSYDSVNRYLQEAAVKREMMVRKQEIENANIRGGSLEADAYSLDEQQLSYGVQLDQENTAERLYEELNDGAPGTNYNETLPADLINARLANRRWINEHDRAQRVAYLRNFIRNAADKGLEPIITQDLIVVGWKKLNKNKTVNIDQVLNRLAQKGL